MCPQGTGESSLIRSRPPGVSTRMDECGRGSRGAHGCRGGDRARPHHPRQTPPARERVKSVASADTRVRSAGNSDPGRQTGLFPGRAHTQGPILFPFTFTYDLLTTWTAAVDARCGHQTATIHG